MGGQHEGDWIGLKATRGGAGEQDKERANQSRGAQYRSAGAGGSGRAHKEEMRCSKALCMDCQLGRAGRHGAWRRRYEGVGGGVVERVNEGTKATSS